MMAQPIFDAFDAIDPERKAHRIYMSPKGKRFEQKMVSKYLKHKHVILLCGHYEGVDERVLDECIDEELSIGDYVLTGGELPAMVVTDAICRYVEGVLAGESLKDESFTDNLLEYPQYTRPQNFRGRKVPEVLVSGNHANIAKWRMQKRIEITAQLRPDLLAKAVLPEEKKKKPRRKKKVDEAPVCNDAE